MRHAIDQGLDSSRDFLSKAGDRARDLSERGILRFEIKQLESQAEQLTAKLGSRAYEVLVKEGKNTVSKSTPGVKEIIGEIQDIEQRVKDKEEQLAALARQEAAGEPSGAEGAGERRVNPEDAPSAGSQQSGPQESESGDHADGPRGGADG
jgi:hypothetical protein